MSVVDRLVTGLVESDAPMQRRVLEVEAQRVAEVEAPLARPDEITARVELDRELTLEEERGIRAYFARRLGPDVGVVVERVEKIPLTPGGKFRRVISTVPLSLGAADIPNRSVDSPPVEAERTITQTPR